MLISDTHVFKGLVKDVSPSQVSAGYLIDAHNIRITTMAEETLLSITNEKGPKKLNLVDSLGNNFTVTGVIIGHAVLNNYLILFVHTDGVSDSILRIDLSNETPVVFNLFQGVDSKFLGFSPYHPIETLCSYENENIQKVYWTDGINQPRVINICKETPYTWSGRFDFVPVLDLQETVEITQDTNANGMFAPGVIQYAFSYYNKYGQESNIFYTSKLYPVAHYDRGGSPEATVSTSFTISVSGIDRNFEFLRIYSIQRTSLNGTPICKRLADIEISSLVGNTVSYVDSGTTGDNIDAAELLYIGGEAITAETFCQKDGTMFLGNISISRQGVSDIRDKMYALFTPKENSLASTDVYIETYQKKCIGKTVSTGDIPYTNAIDISGFKYGEYYRIGMQFQHETGKWSEPVWVRDYQITPMVNSGMSEVLSEDTVTIPQVAVTMTNAEVLQELISLGYKNARLMMAVPSYKDRSIICQGIAAPTLYTEGNRNTKDASGNAASGTGTLYAQASWMFRPKNSKLGNTLTSDTTAYGGAGYIPSSGNVFNTQYMAGLVSGSKKLASPALRSTEVGATLGDDDDFKIDKNMFTLHTPEVIFDESLYSIEWQGLSLHKVGEAYFDATFGDIDIQTSSSSIGSAKGFIHKSIKTTGDAALVSGLFYEDYIVDEEKDTNPVIFERYDKMKHPVKWPVYLWHKNGSLNNDIDREGSSSILSKKKISNYHMSSKNTYNPEVAYNLNGAGLFSSDALSMIKVDGKPYMGNIDTLVAPDTPEYKYMVGEPMSASTVQNATGDFFGTSYYRLGLSTPGDTTSSNGLWQLNTSTMKWSRVSSSGDNIGDKYPDLCETSEGVRIKYKSTPHIVCLTDNGEDLFNTSDCCLPILELRKPYDKNTYYGGQSEQALKDNQWIPISEPQRITQYGLGIISDRGDTYYQRYECLKTYPYTQEDINQIVDIASFRVETHLNIDGRYDRNRGQVNNLNMSPTNFNLYNSVYSQIDNFFTYNILDDDYYKINSFPNQVTWTLEKQAGSDVDVWTTITLASTMDMDGNFGSVQALTLWNNNIICFQDRSVNVIAFNSRVEIPTNDNNPIEISNNYKVSGKQIICDGIGCTNKFAICPTHSLLYFIGSNGNLMAQTPSEGLKDLSQSCGMVSWTSIQKKTLWTAAEYSTRLFYDSTKKDVYIVTEDAALCFNENMQAFVSFLSYGNSEAMFCIGDKFFCINSGEVFRMFEGTYNNFFDSYEDYYITFVSNGIQEQNNTYGVDKCFTNIQMRADRWADKIGGSLSPESPFDYLRVWNEYQDTGEVLLKNIKDRPSNLKKKFRIWGVQIPRDAANRRDRIRNPWCKVTLGSSPRYNNGNDSAINLHDVSVQFLV